MIIIWIKAHWKLVLIGVGMLILLIWIGSITGTNRKLYNMALDNLREDQSKAIERDKKWIKDCEDEILKLRGEVEKSEKEKAAVRVKADQSATEVLRLKGENEKLRIQLQNIVVSDDPDRIIDDLNKLGYGPIRRVR